MTLTITKSGNTAPASNNATATARSKFEETKARMQANKQAGATATQSNSDDKPQIKFWVNIGRELEYQELNEATGEMEDKTVFISLETKIALDNIEVKGTRSNNEFQQVLAIAKEQLLKDVVGFAQGIAEGESKICNGLKVQIRHAGNNEKVIANAKEHPMLKAMGDGFQMD